MGNPAKPAALKILEGNRGRREIKEGPKFKPVTPECPKWLSREARKEWQRLAPELERLGMLTEADKGDFAAYCQAYARWMQAEQAVDRYGLTFETRHIEMAEDGNTFERISIRPRPEVLQAHRERMSMMRLGALFGFSPSDRGRMALNQTSDDEEKARMVD